MTLETLSHGEQGRVSVDMGPLVLTYCLWHGALTRTRGRQPPRTVTRVAV